MISRENLLKRTGIFIVAGGILAGCAAPRTQYIPYPSSGESAIDYNKKIAECESWARRQPGADPQRITNQSAQDAAGTMVAGALIGGLIDGWDGALKGVIAGGVTGGTYGGIQGSQQAQAIYNRALEECMRKR
jgi:hypothetical protein